MKKLILPLILVLFQSQYSVAQTFNSPVEYLEYVNKIEEPITKQTWKYTKTVAHSKSARRIENVRKALVKTIQTAKSSLEKNTNGYKGDVDFHKKVIEYLTFSEYMIEEEYAKIVDMQEIAEQSYDYMEAYITTREKVDARMDEEHNKLVEAQKEYAKKYDITLIDGGETEISKKMKLSNQVFKYHSDIYLVFFKCNYTDQLLQKSIETKDLAAIQQNANALQQYAEEGIAKIDTFEPIKNDKLLANATKECLKMYAEQAKNYVPKVVDFITFNSQFEDAKAAFERKTNKERTKEVVDEYNTMINQINKRINDYNSLNTNTINTKNRLLNNWENVGNQYIAKYVPNE